MLRTRVIDIYRSNRVEVLLDELATVLAIPLANPLTPDVFIVQGRGMALHLMMELSKRAQIFANGRFFYPRNFVEHAFEAVLGQSNAASLSLDRDRLRWLVLAELPALLSESAFQPISRFLRDDSEGLKRLQLATRIAEVFDDYLTYRPNMVQAWERSETGSDLPPLQRWQPLLWRALAKHLGGQYLAAREAHFHAALGSDRPFAGLPKRLSVFGISTLPPLYVRAIAALTCRVEVRLFLFSPCQEFWAGPLVAPHPLLGSLGKLGAEFQNVLASELEALGVYCNEHDLYREPARPHSVLGQLQSDLLQMGAPPSSCREPDGSIVLHACHSPMRQVEVLRDQLLALFDQGKGIEPRDVIVMAPDIEEYAPLIEAVFERSQGDPEFIPYRIVDRSLYRQSSVIEAFLRILRQVGQRAAASEVLDLLSLEAIARKFALSPEDIEKLRRWVVQSNIRWGIDARHRAEHGQPELDVNTWNFGLTRLLLGYALPSGSGNALFEGVAPYNEVEGQDAELLGRFVEFTQRLFDRLAALSMPRVLGEWQSALMALIDELIFSEGDAAWQAQKIRSALARLSEHARTALFDQPLGARVMLKLLEEELDETQLARGFLAGGVTFCAMIPMRSIPFKVVCLLGMNEADFPRTRQFADFDLTRPGCPIAGAGLRVGDRSRRDDDRYLFLEALLAAREHLLILFAGQSIRDNSLVPPSVVVSELNEHLSRLCGLESPNAGKTVHGEAKGHGPFCIMHPLQAFSTRYFDGSNPVLFSYAHGYCEGARSLQDGSRTDAFLFRASLEEPLLETVPSGIALAELLRFFEGPIQYLLNRRLRVLLSDATIDVPDREPWELSKLDQWDIGNQLLALDLAGQARESYAVLRASGKLPPGTPGAHVHELLVREVQPIAEQVRMLQAGTPEPPLAVDLELPSGARLFGEFGDRWSSGQVLAQYTRISGKHLLRAWIRHLTLCASLLGQANCRSTLVGRPSDSASKQSCAVFAWGPIEAPLEELANLAELYRIGQSQPLLLFPKSSFEYAKSFLENGDAKRALKAARSKWRFYSETGEIIGEGLDAHLQRVFSKEYELGQPTPFAVAPNFEFEVLAERVFAPLLLSLAP